MITYVGDSTVLICKCQECAPLNWTWYHMNGSVQVRSYFFNLKKKKFLFHSKIITDLEFQGLFICLLSFSLVCIHKERIVIKGAVI